MTTHPRLTDWEQRLSDYFSHMEGQSFVFGKSDCCHFAARAIKAMTNHNPMAHLPSYTSAKQSHYVMKALLREQDDGDYRNFLPRTLSVVLKDFEKISPSFLQRGDIALVHSYSVRHSTGIPIVGIVDLSGVFIKALSLRGLASFSIDRALVGWRV